MNEQTQEQILSAPHYLRGAQAAQFGVPQEKCPFNGWYAESWLAGWADEREATLSTYAREASLA